MKQLTRLIATLFCFVLVNSLSAQEMRMVKGTLRTADGSPIVGVSIVEKGTQHGTISDLDGNYSIVVPLGAEIVCSLIGMLSESKIVTYANSDAAPGYEIPKPVKQTKYRSSYTPIENFPVPDSGDTVRTEGAAYFSNGTKSYVIKNSYEIDPRHIADVNFGKGQVEILNRQDKYIAIPSVSFYSSYNNERAIRLPQTQHSFAQGRSVDGIALWRGPETGEVFSWGPAISDLEYDGSEYGFDNSGRLVPRGTGNGKRVHTYSPASFFVNGQQFKNTVKIQTKREKYFYELSVTHTFHSGIIPSSRETSNLVDAKLGKNVGKIIRLKSNMFFEKSVSKLMSGSPATNLVLSSVFTTPPTFDNSNEYTSSKASGTTDAYLFAGRQRSSALYHANNPYWLINYIRDEEKHTIYNVSASFEIQPVRPLTFSWNASLQNQEYRNDLGYPGAMWGVDSVNSFERNTTLQTMNSTEMLKFYKNRYAYRWYKNIEFETWLMHSLDYTETALDRKGYSKASNALYPVETDNYRRTNTFTWVTNVNWDNILIVRPVQSLVYSENNNYSSGSMYMPSLSGGINVHELFNLDCYIKIRSSWGCILSEVPLTFNPGSYSVQNFPSAAYLQSSYLDEVQPDFGLKPSRIIKKGIGTDFGFFYNSLTGTIDYFAGKVRNEIFPVTELNRPVLKNLANYETHGLDLDLQYRFGNNNWINYTLGFVFSKNTSRVSKLYTNEEMVRMSGYTDVFTALVPGKPKGVIVGTAYMRNENGQLLIGEDGYPMVDSRLHVLGDPNPDFTLGLNGSFNVRKFSCNILFEYQQGGEVWNGTQNVLSYYGVSEVSARDRGITGYIFNGVTTDGQVNSTPVDFASPTEPLESNRWVRYGVTGVAEDAMEDATSFRISTIQLTYGSRYKHIYYKISAFTMNPWIIAGYKGSDPNAALWGNASAQGLDLFNCPLVRSFGASFNIEF